MDKLNCTVAVVDDFKQATEILSKQQFDLVLLDFHMSIMDGFEATRLIVNDSNLSSIPIISLSADTQDSNKEDSLNLVMVDFIAKPFDSKVLTDKVLKAVKS